MSECKVSLVPTEYVDTVWHSIVTYVDGAADYTFGRFTTEDIKEGLLTKPHQLWIAFDDTEVYGFVVTEVYQYPRKKVLTMHFTGGHKLPLWKKPMLRLLQQFGRDNGCTVIESYGRPGWERVFKNDGYNKQFILYELPVER